MTISGRGWKANPALQTALQNLASVTVLSQWTPPNAAICTSRSKLSGSVRRLVEDASGVDDDGLAGHGLGAAHGDHHIGAVVLVGRPFQERARRGALDLL